MKREIFFVIFLFLISNSFAQEIAFQQERYSPSETIIGSLENILTPLTSDNLDVYEGRREVLFEKGVTKANDTYYFYIIPTKEGQFVLKVANVLYNNSGSASSISLEKSFNVTQTNNSIGFGIRPGVYEGTNPETVIVNLKSEAINVSLKKEFIELKPFESRRIILDAAEGFSLYKIGNYSMPVIKFGDEVIINETNNSEINETPLEKNYAFCLKLNFPAFFSVTKEKQTNFSASIQNNCSENLTNLHFKTETSRINFPVNNFTIEDGEELIFNVSIFEKTAGDYSENATLFVGNKSVVNISAKIYCFSNNTTLNLFTDRYDSTEQQNCSSANGKFCDEGTQYCNSENRFLDLTANKMCCLGECVSIKGIGTNWANIIMALLGIGVIAAIGYMLINRSKGLKAPKAEDKFKEAEKRYEKNISGTKK